MMQRLFLKQGTRRLKCSRREGERHSWLALGAAVIFLSFALSAWSAASPDFNEISVLETNAVVSVKAIGNGPGLENKQKLGVGDRVTFRVVEDQEDPKLLTISDSGELNIPELGLISAAGKTCGQLASEIKTELEKKTYYHATVILGIDLLNKTVSGRKVYVVGQVKVAGPQEIPAGETWTVSKAVMKAGGFTDYADKKRVRLVRGRADGKPGKTFYVNVNDIWVKGRTELDLSVDPEDLIYVPARAVNLY